MLLKGFDRHGRKVFLHRTGVVDHRRHTFNDNVRFCYMVVEMLQEEVGQASVTGVAFIEACWDTFFPSPGGKKISNLPLFIGIGVRWGDVRPRLHLHPDGGQEVHDRLAGTTIAKEKKKVILQQGLLTIASCLSSCACVSRRPTRSAPRRCTS